MTTDGTTPLRLYLMQVASLTPMNVPVSVPVPCYLVQTGEKNILIDSGLPANLQIPADRPAPVMGKNVIEQLALLGLQPGDIDMLVCTHFDLDHCGHHEDFPDAQLVVQREHYEAAREGHPRFAPHRAHWDFPAERYRLVDGDTTLLPGLELIATGGHVPGHQSVLVRLPETGPVLMTIDAVPTQNGFQSERQAGPIDENAEQTIASTRKLLDVVKREHVALVIFGHDNQQWPKLTKVPEYYG